MKTSRKTANLVLALLSVLALPLSEHQTKAQTSAFTYQGCLTDNHQWSNGHYDLTFQLFDASAGGNPVGSTLTSANQTLTNGLFSVALDFGAGAFTGANRWLQIGVRTNGSGGAFVTLSPRQMLTPSPYALYTDNAAAATIANNVAANSITAAGIQNSTITAAKIASGQVVKSLNGLTDNLSLSAGANVTLTPSGNGIQVSAADATRWSLTGNTGTIAGVHFLGTTDNKPLQLRANNMPALTLTPSQWGPSILVGGGGATANGATAISMGYGTTASGAASVALGDRTTASGWESTAIGEVTMASGDYATAMGNYTKATNSCATAMGTNTLAGGLGATAMGRNTKALGSGSVAMGLWSTASGPNSLADGYSCTAAGSSSVALGYYAYADHGYSFVWNDGSSGNSGDIHSTGQNQFIIGASGGVGIGAAPGDALLDIQGDVRLNKHDLYFREATDRNHGLGWYGAGKLFGTNSPDGPVLYGWSGGGLGSTSDGSQLALQWFASGNVTVRGTLAQGSDRNVKTDFTPVNPREVLDRVAAMPVQSWRYKTEADDTRHLGPVSQDFYAAFGLGEDNLHITTVDEGGVALAAIQGLNQKLQDELDRQHTENAKLKQQNDSLAKRLNELEAAVKKLAEQN